MPELVPLTHEAPAPPAPLWLPGQKQLLERPVEYGIAIDPPGSLEIDDALSVELLDEKARLFAYKVHIADGGLLAGTEHMDTAREKGWTVYRRRGGADTMLPKEVVSLLTLDREAGEIGQPALTVSFVAGEGVTPRDFTIYKSRLLCTAMTYAAYARRVRQHYHPNNPLGFEDEALIHEASVYLGNSARGMRKLETVRSIKPDQSVPFLRDNAYDTVALFMKAANIGMARLSLDDGLPYVFRNHHITHFEHKEGNAIRELYPDSELFAKHNIAWYSRIPTQHAGIRQAVFGHATSPLRRSPDLFNHVNRSAVLNGQEPPYDEAYLDEFVRELAQKIKEIRKLGSGVVTATGRVA